MGGPRCSARAYGAVASALSAHSISLAVGELLGVRGGTIASLDNNIFRPGRQRNPKGSKSFTLRGGRERKYVIVDARALCSCAENSDCPNTLGYHPPLSSMVREGGRVGGEHALSHTDLHSFVGRWNGAFFCPLQLA